jgi:hypothetical protein
MPEITLISREEHQKWQFHPKTDDSEEHAKNWVILTSKNGKIKHF